MTGLPVVAASPLAREVEEEPSSHPAGSERDRLRDAVEHAAEFLPAQGPIRVFIHHNTLHAFEDLPFDEGVRTGADIFGCEPYLPEDRYREKFRRGRIRVEDLCAELRDDLGPRGDEPVLMFGTRFDIRLSMLRYPLRQATGDELRWFMAETDALRRFRDESLFAVKHRVIRETKTWIQGMGPSGESVSSSGVSPVIAELLRERSGRPRDRWSDADWEAFTLEALWRICRHGVHTDSEPRAKRAAPLRHRDALLQAVGHDSDLLVNDVLIRFCASYLDQGFSQWTLPMRERGFAASFAYLYRDARGIPERWRAGLSDCWSRLLSPDFDALSSIAESLRRLGVAESEWRSYLTATFLALRGWAGMIRQIEMRSDRVPRPIAEGSLVEYLAVRLILECAAVEHLAKEQMGYEGPLSELRQACQARQRKPARDRQDQRAFVLFQLAQTLGWLPRELLSLSRADWRRLLHEVESFGDLERRRIYHRAFERRYRIQVLDALHFRSRIGEKPRPTPQFQVMCCLDEREESFRRHFEEVSPETETFGLAGFFNVPIYFRGVTDAHFVPLCPIVMRPQHWVQEEAQDASNGAYETQTNARRLVGHAVHQLQRRSQTFWGGALIAAGLGALATFPLVARVLFPRTAKRMRRSAGKWVLPQATRLKFRRTDPQPSPAETGIGFTVEEMAEFGERMLRDIGLTSDFAPFIAILGHGSSSLNNPHESAYACGACGGSAGGPNARTTALILNQPDVRAKLAERGIVIPEGTIFVGGCHNTCNDEVALYDLELVPESHQDLLTRFRIALDETCRRNAHERTRRFLSADLEASFEEAQRHVEARSEDLAQPRPECGHATNAVCFVGRRQRTRGLFMDRRTFLVSYDPNRDDDELTILSRILAAVVPVCAGINLEYYFSYVDPVGFGCSTKLPHNVTSLVGVMDGMASDLRPGLPWQMVEIHEPFRLLFVLETKCDLVPKLFARVPPLEKLARNEWIQLAIIDPDSERIAVYQQGEFRPYEPESLLIRRASSSWEWYRGSRDHLPFAVID